MLSVMQHRGPDDSGQFIEPLVGSGWLGLGHNRLSILDVSSHGHQPMLSADGRFALIFNGEIYNYREIAKEIGSDEILDISSGDTAVVLAALIKWGPKAFEKFNGMWALAFYDRAKSMLLLSRDRFGVKPLYIYQSQHQLIFASEIKAILSASQQHFRLNAHVSARYLVQGLLNAQSETFFEKIVQFPPASFSWTLLSDSFTGDLLYHRFWYHPFELDNVDSHIAPPPVDVIRETFIDSVRLRLRSDVPVGTLLSGGIDSSSILGAVRVLGMLDNVSVFSVISDDSEHNEEPFIDLMAEYTGCRIVKFQSHYDPASLLDDVPEVCWFHDQPFGGLANIAHRRLMQLAHDRGIKVLLTGQGADEQLGGYNKFLYFYLQDQIRKGKWLHAARLLASFLRRDSVIPEFRLREAKRYLPRLFNRPTFHFLGSILQDASLLDTGLGIGYQEREWRDIRSLSIPALLHYEDRSSMSWSLEMRVPFLDYRLVELFGNTPPSCKLDAGWTKAIFRNAIEGLVPKTIQYRRDKKGFNVPEGKWIRNVLRNRFLDMFRNPMLAEKLGYIRRPALPTLYNSYLGGSTLISEHDIFRVYCFEAFLRRFEAFIDFDSRTISA